MPFLVLNKDRDITVIQTHKKYDKPSPHYGTDITSKVSSTGRTCEIFLRVQPVRVDHEVTIGKISRHAYTT